MNSFEVFDLPRKLGIDTEDLQRRFYELSRQTHPDFHQAAPPGEQARVLEVSARLNAAYRALSDPVARVEYLIRLEEGRETAEGATTKPKAPPELLEEMFEIQEALQEAKAGALDEATRAGLHAQRELLLARVQSEEGRITGALSREWDEAVPAERPHVLAALKAALATRAYLWTVIDDLRAALGGEDAAHVAHHRH